MAKLPTAVSILSNGSPWQMTRLLIAAILSSEEEMLIVNQAQLDIADNFKLITTVDDKGGVVLIAEPK